MTQQPDPKAGVTTMASITDADGGQVDGLNIIVANGDDPEPRPKMTKMKMTVGGTSVTVDSALAKKLRAAGVAS